MKRLLALLLAVIMVLCCLTACEKKDEDEDEDSSYRDDRDDKDEDKDDEDDEDDEGNGGIFDFGDQDEDEQLRHPEVENFQEITVVDDEYCVIRVTDVEPNNKWGFTVKVYFENKTQDTTLMISVQDSNIKSVAVDTYFAAEVAPGKKVNEKIIFTEEMPEDFGAYSDIFLNFRVYDADDWSAENLTDGQVHVYPYGEDQAAVYTRAPQDTDVVIVDNDECVIRILDAGKASDWGYSMKAYVENKTADQSLSIYLSEAAVNGVNMGGFFSSQVAPGCKDFVEFELSEVLPEDIGEFTDVFLKFTISDPNEWDTIAEAEGHVYPKGQENAAPFIRESKPTDTVLMDNEYIQVIAIGYRQDEWGYAADLYIVNKMDIGAVIKLDDVAVNGFMLNPYFYHDISAKGCDYQEISWSMEDLNDQGITKVEEITFTLRLANAEDWFSDELASVDVTLKP